jgi:hypothetical protein
VYANEFATSMPSMMRFSSGEIAEVTSGSVRKDAERYDTVMYGTGLCTMAILRASHPVYPGRHSTGRNRLRQRAGCRAATIA